MTTLELNMLQKNERSTFMNRRITNKYYWNNLRHFG